MLRPPLGIVARAQIDRVIDGDTVDVFLTIPLRVRLLKCWAPEIRGESRDAGFASKRALEELIPQGARVLVQVPTKSASSLQDVMTFGRALASVWRMDDELTVSERMVLGGFATEQKKAI